MLNEAEVEREDYKLVFSDNEYEMKEDSAVEEVLVDDNLQEEDRSFYRDLNNRENYPRFANQTRNPIEVVSEPEEEYYGEDDMPELYDPENREEFNFDLFVTD